MGSRTSLALVLAAAVLLVGGEASAGSIPDVSAEVGQVARWVVESGDNDGMPYLIIDKVNANVFVFHGDGRLRGADAALLGMARGDGSVDGIGDRPLSAIGPADRTTPAGRFLANLDRDVHGKPILLIDYDASLALHPVIAGTPAERRAERLQSPTAADNRISFGCINVSVKFYEDVVQQAFASSPGLVYILPETSSASELFGLEDGPSAAQQRVSPHP